MGLRTRHPDLLEIVSFVVIQTDLVTPAVQTVLPNWLIKGLVVSMIIINTIKNQKNFIKNF